MKMKEIFTVDNMLKIIKFFKPEFYNKITWTVVIAGLALIGTPLLEKILNAVLEKHLSLSITDSNDSIIGLSLVLIGLTYNLITVYLYKYLIEKQNIVKDTKIIEKDKKLFEDFLEQLPSSGSIEFLRGHAFENSFERNRLTQLIEIYHNWNGAEYEFLNIELETLRKNLFEKIGNFLHQSAMNTYTQGNGFQWAIPDNYIGDYNLPEHVIETIKNLDTLAEEVYLLHQNFVRECRKKLV